MTPEAQRIAIAGACGYINIQLPFGWIPPEDIGDLPIMVELLDYLNDLNAMHEAEMWMFESYETPEGAERLSLYTKFLCQIKHPLFATASQRAEAFLRTLNLWDDSK